jgi:tetratricopeptide (TPR) repeat protein
MLSWRAVSGGLAVAGFAAILTAGTPQFDRAIGLYHRTEYRQSLAVLEAIHDRDAAAWKLIGQDRFMLGEYKKATEALEKAAALEPSNSEIMHWLGRTWGRRAETGNIFSQPGSASKTRQYLEKAVALDPKNGEAVNDLFDYYLEAPGFLGGGMQKAEALAKHIADLDAAEGYYARAQIADKRKQFDTAEEQLRRAAELAPRQVGRVLDVAKYLAKRGRFRESEALFDQAARMAPDSPKVLFERASTYIKEQRNLREARQLLEQYLRSQLTPDDPPRERAQELLKKTGS